jgi:hypothetical protein
MSEIIKNRFSIDHRPTKPVINFQEEDQHFDELNIDCSINKSKLDQSKFENISINQNYSHFIADSQIVQQQGFNSIVWKKRALRIVYHISKFLLSLQ